MMDGDHAPPTAHELLGLLAARHCPEDAFDDALTRLKARRNLPGPSHQLLRIIDDVILEAATVHDVTRRPLPAQLTLAIDAYLGRKFAGDYQREMRDILPSITHPQAWH